MATEVSADDLTELYKTGAVSLPNGAQTYAEAATEVNNTASSEGAGFAGGLGVSPVLSSFQAMRNTFQDEILVRTRNNVVKAGEALCQIAENFAARDGSNQTALNELKEELDSGERTGDDGEKYPLNPDEKPPEQVDEAPESEGEETEETNGDPDREEAPPSPGDDLHDN